MSKCAGFIGSVVGGMLAFAILNFFCSSTDALSCTTLICGAAAGAVNAVFVLLRNEKYVVGMSIVNMLSIWLILLLFALSMVAPQVPSVLSLLAGTLGMAFVGLCSGVGLVAGQSLARKACGCA